MILKIKIYILLKCYLLYHYTDNLKRFCLFSFKNLFILKKIIFKVKFIII